MTDTTQTDYDKFIERLAPQLPKYSDNGHSDEPFHITDRFITPWPDLLNLKPPEWQIDGILPKGQTNWLYGATGIGKSLIALDLALTVAYGEQAFNHFETQQTNVLWLDYENGPQVTMQRVEHMGHLPAQLALDEQIKFGTFPESINQQSANQLVNECERHHIGLLVIDSAGVAIEGDSNSADTYTELAQHLLNPLKNLNTTILILDNIGKDKGKGMLGSSRKESEAGVTWQLERTPGGLHHLTSKKQRFIGIEQGIALQQHLDPLTHRLSNATTIELDADQQNIVLYLDTLNGANMFPNTALHDKIKTQFKIRSARIYQAINWWDKGNHPEVDREVPGSESREVDGK